MDVQVIANIITTIGFPIVACGALFWYINKQSDQHKEEMLSMRNTIEANTHVLSELKELISVIVKKDM